jgi:cell division protein FtsZ
MEKKMEKEVSTFDKQEMDLYVDATVFSDAIKEKIKGMLGVVLSTGENDIRLEFDDFKTIIKHAGKAFVGTGEFEGENSAMEALKLAITNATIDFDLMGSITGILIHIETHPDFPLMKIAEAMEIINENAHYEADVIWGISMSKSVGESYVKVTGLFTE